MKKNFESQVSTNLTHGTVPTEAHENIDRSHKLVKQRNHKVRYII
jgi:hypothetical protein